MMREQAPSLSGSYLRKMRCQNCSLFCTILRALCCMLAAAPRDLAMRSRAHPDARAWSTSIIQRRQLAAAMAAHSQASNLSHASCAPATFVQADCRSLDVTWSNQFDLVVDKGTFDAVQIAGSDDCQKFLHEMRRVLKKPGGKLLSLTDDIPEQRLDLLRGFLPDAAHSFREASSGGWELDLLCLYEHDPRVSVGLRKMTNHQWNPNHTPLAGVPVPTGSCRRTRAAPAVLVVGLSRMCMCI